LSVPLLGVKGRLAGDQWPRVCSFEIALAVPRNAYAIMLVNFFAGTEALWDTECVHKCDAVLNTAAANFLYLG
jgi:hypothetical protein